MVPTLLAALEFRSNNDRHRPVMQALDFVKRFADTKVHTFPPDADVPLAGVVHGLWHDARRQMRPPLLLRPLSPDARHRSARRAVAGRGAPAGGPTRRSSGRCACVSSSVIAGLTMTC